MNAIVSRKSHVVVWIALLALLFLSLGLAQVHLGAFNTAVGLAIALAKMSLVVLIFMHGRFEKPLTWLFMAAGVIWFLIMVDLTLSDYLTRQDTPGPQQSWKHSESAPPTLQPSR